MSVNYEEILHYATQACEVYSSPQAIVALLGDCFTMTETDGVVEIAVKGTDSFAQGVLNVFTTTMQAISWFYNKEEETRTKFTGNMESLDHYQYIALANLIIGKVDQAYPNAQKYMLCGHSRGGLIAMYCGLVLLKNSKPVEKIYTYGAPKLYLNNDIAVSIGETVISQWKNILVQLEHQYDPVPKIVEIARTSLGSKDMKLIEGHVIKISNPTADAHSMVQSYIPGICEIVEAEEFARSMKAT